MPYLSDKPKQPDLPPAGTLMRRLADGVPDAHAELFDWHCNTFFPFDQVFTPTERNYVDLCLAFHAEAPYRHFSHVTYSHRVAGEHVNSSRTAHGSFRHFRKLRDAFFEVLAYRGIPAHAYDDGDFRTGDYGPYGLGWDFEEDHFKVYYAVRQPRFLELDGALTLYQSTDAPVDRIVGLSHTWQKGILLEKKVYLYPTEDKGRGLLSPLAPFETWVDRVAMMVSDRRGVEYQIDLSDGDVKDIGRYLNAAGRRVLDAYGGIGGHVDAMTWKTPQRYTLYFP